MPETFKHILTEHPSDGVVVVRLNRPEVRNSLNLLLRRELAEFFLRAAEDDSLRCVVLAGSPKAFCAGADLQEYLNATPVEIMERNTQQSWKAVSTCQLPIIAAVRGFALGGGCELAMQADIIVAAETAVFGQPEVKIGLMPGAGATQRLTKAVGKYTAMLLMLTGRYLPAKEAQILGLASMIVPDDDVESTAFEIANHIAGLPKLAVRQIKESILLSHNAPLDVGLGFEQKAFQVLFSTHDKTEGIRAFLEKRPPRFEGR